MNPDKDLTTAEKKDFLKTYVDMMQTRASTMLQGWRSMNIRNDPEVANYIHPLLVSGDQEAICQFETAVFVHGVDPKTYMRRQQTITSTLTVELGKEIMDKPTVLVNEPNGGGVAEHDGCIASTSLV
uniref:Uncharacterized protein n=1 Tax=Caenorhabditis japonica TaxID=281687 RepID=A0A8R1HKB5_CAEJA